MGNPPGGPPDAAPPVILGVRPESGAVVPTWDDEAEIRFDEVIDEMGGGGQTGGALASLVLLSPVASGTKVEWHRDRITVEPREGWTRGRVYRLELLPGILDLRRNRLDSGRVVLFSTGPAIGAASVSGLALQWVEQRAIPRALIEAVPLPDSVGYVAIADSSGHFRLGGLAPGRYAVFAIADQNTNRRRDRREAYDSALVEIDSTATVALFAFVHDTVGPRLRLATHLDSLHVRLEFNQALNPAVPLDTAQVRAFELPDSTRVRLAGLLTAAVFDSLAQARRAERDSAAARDTAAAVPARPAAPPAPLADTTAVRRALR
ncbi:MAG: Ig-like domain-containing protein, partial [Gemmatimonadales bacterium]